MVGWIKKRMRAQILKEIYASQADVGAWTADCTMKFVDSEGKRYYRYRDEMKVPIDRMERTQQIIREVSNRISDDDLQGFLASCKAELYREAPANERLQNLGAMMTMLDERIKDLAPPELLMRLVCGMYIREDQDPSVWDENIEEEKFNQLIADQRGELGAFFAMCGLGEYLPSLKNLQKGSTEMLNNLQKRAEKFREASEQLHVEATK